MALFGVQIVTTLIAATILSRIISLYSFTRFLVCGLLRCAVPTDQQLLEASGSCKIKNKGKRRPTGIGDSSSDQSDVFYFPRATTIQLDTSTIQTSDIAILPLYSSHQWLIDFGICAACVYSVSELAYNCFIPWFQGSSNHTLIPARNPDPKSTTSLQNLVALNARINLSLVWIVLTLWFAFRTLVALTAIYFRSDSKPAKSDPKSTKPPSSRSSLFNLSSSSEWALVFAAAFFFFVAAIFFLALDGRMIDLGLQVAHGNMTLGAQPELGTPILSWGAFHAVIAFVASLIGALFVYPGLKFAKSYLDAVSRPSTPAYQRLLLHMTFIAPLIPILLWLIPITEHIAKSLLNLSRSVSAAGQPFLTLLTNFTLNIFTNHLDSIRLLVCLFIIFSRLVTMRWCLQSYLYSAQDRLDRFSREPGRTSNVEVQRLVASIFYCFNLVALQFLAPLAILFCFVCLYKNLAGLHWLPWTYGNAVNHLGPNLASQFDPVSNGSHDMGPNTIDLNLSWSSTLIEARLAFGHLMNQLASRGTVVARGVLSFLVWWTLVAWQSVSFLGLAYHRFAME